MSLSEMVNLPTAEQFADLITTNKAMANSLADIANRPRPYSPESLSTFAAVQGVVRLGLGRQYFKERTCDINGELVQNGTFFTSKYGTGSGQFDMVWEVIGIDREIVTDVNGTPLTTIDADGSTIPAHSLTLKSRYVFPTKMGMSRYTYPERYSIWAGSNARTWLNDEYLTGVPFAYSFTYAGSRELILSTSPLPTELEAVQINGMKLASDSYTYAEGVITIEDTVSLSNGDIITVLYFRSDIDDGYPPCFLSSEGLESSLKDVLAYRKSLTYGITTYDKVFTPSVTEYGSIIGTDSVFNDETYGMCYPAFYHVVTGEPLSSGGETIEHPNRLSTLSDGTVPDGYIWTRSRSNNDKSVYQLNSTTGSASTGSNNANNREYVVPCIVIA